MIAILRKAPLASFRTTRRDERGAITVDWVVLTAGVLALIGAVAFTNVGQSLNTLDTAVGTELSETGVGIDGQLSTAFQ